MGLTFGAGAIALLPRRRPLHGDARFATRREIRKARLLGHEGIILGRLGNDYLMLPGQQGVELEAPPRSGKGVGVVIPNLLNWPGSVIVSDIKGENWMRTAGFRAAHGQDVHLFDPLSEDERSSRWNPLAYVSDVPYRCIDDLQRIATMLYPDPQGADPFWTSSARSLFLGIALYLFETEGTTRTIGEILRQGMASDAEGFQKHWRRVIDSCERAGYPLSQEAIQTLYDVIDLAPVTASSIRKTFTSRLDLWLNPMIDAATSANDFDFRDLRKRPISIYARINPDNVARLQPLLNLFFQQAIGLQTRELPEEQPGAQASAAARARRVRGARPHPGDRELDRVPARLQRALADHRAVALAARRDATATKARSRSARCSRRASSSRRRSSTTPRRSPRSSAPTTVKQKSITRGRMWGGGRTPTVSISDQPRRLLLPQEVKEMGPDRMILFYEGLRPVYGQRICYYRDKHFAKRELPPPEVPKLDIAAVKRVATQPGDADATSAGNTIEPVWPATPTVAAGRAGRCRESRLDDARGLLARLRPHRDPEGPADDRRRSAQRGRSIPRDAGRMRSKTWQATSAAAARSTSTVSGSPPCATRRRSTTARSRTCALRFFNGRSEVANTRVPADEARDLLGESNYAAIAEAAAAATPAGEPNFNAAIVKGELRGKSLEFRQVTLAGYEATHSENTIAFDSRAQRKARPSPDTDEHPPPQTASDPHHLEAAPATENTRGDTPHTADGPEDQPAADRTDPKHERDDETPLGLARAAAVPDSIAERFLKVDDKYYFPDKTLAFIDRGTKLKAETHNLEVIRCLVTIAEARDWQAISVTGTPEFRKEVWREASLRGLDVRGYEPTALDREELRRAIEKRHGPNDVNREASQRVPDRPARGGVDAQPVRATATRDDRSRRSPPQATDDVRTALLTGRLLEYGAAPYQFDPKQGLSYYVKLDTDRGERVVWGIDLERALVESRTRVRIGDVVAIENQGSKPVTIKVPRLDAAGNVIGEKEVQTHRNTWLIEKPSYFDERAEKAAAFRNGDDEQAKAGRSLPRPDERGRQPVAR